jgi:hypothetical protein
MLKKLVPWAVAFASALLSSRAMAAGAVDSPPVPAAMWPPHRPHPTISRKRELDAKGKPVKRDRFRMAVIDGRVTIAETTKLVGGKGLRP